MENIIIFYNTTTGVIEGTQRVSKVLTATEITDLGANGNQGIIQVLRMDPDIRMVSIDDVPAFQAAFTVNTTTKKLVAVV